ncbi:MAG: sulfatase [Spirosoma sp.]|nr:sulfatase [Spirosoma sp.]
MKKPFLFFLILAAGFLLSPTAPKKPNVVLIFMDDMGYGDLSCYGALNYTTPNIDQLATDGTRFTNFLTTHAVCTASRAALLTGCYANRLSLSGALSPSARNGLHPDEETLAELLKEQGYATGIFGKWHLGNKPEFLPTKQGFDEYFGIPYSNDMWPVDYDGTPAISGNKTQYPPLPMINGTQPVDTIRTLTDQGLLTKRLTERAVSFITKNRNGPNAARPFFLYLPHHMVHVPIAASPRFMGKTGAGLFADVMQEVDWSVGEVMNALKKNGLDKNTLVIFTSDNGPWLTFGNHAGSSGGFREGKGTTYEGGHRVPGLMRWPGVIPAGRVCNQLLTTLDLLPTIAGFCGARLPKKPIDGKNAVALLKGAEQSPRQEFYYYYRKNSLEAVRRGNMKLVFAHPGRRDEGYVPGKDGYRGETNENFPTPPGLYDLAHDPGERYDLSTTYPLVKADLEALAEKARADLGDDLQQRTGANVRAGGIASMK